MSSRRGPSSFKAEIEEKTIEKGEATEKTKKRSRRRGRVTVFDNWCKGCGICVAFCPQNVFDAKPDGHILIAREERCTACYWCDHHCPDFAIVVEEVIDNDEDTPSNQSQEATP